MKKITEIQVPAKRIAPKVKTIETIYCDLPGCEEKVISKAYNKAGGVCTMCERDMCYDHMVYDDYYSDDYPSKYCHICYKLYIPARTALLKKQDEEDTALYRKICKQSLATKNVI